MAERELSPGERGGEVAQLMGKAVEHVSEVVSAFDALRHLGVSEINGLRTSDLIEGQRFLLGLLTERAERR